jgi:hypothetical protein
MDGLTLDVLTPSMPFLADTGNDVNENSIVTRLTYFNGSRPFTELFIMVMLEKQVKYDC